MHQLLVAGLIVGGAVMYLGFCWIAGKFCGFNDRTPE